MTRFAHKSNVQMEQQLTQGCDKDRSSNSQSELGRNMFLYQDSRKTPSVATDLHELGMTNSLFINDSDVDERQSKSTYRFTKHGNLNDTERQQHQGCQNATINQIHASKDDSDEETEWEPLVSSQLSRRSSLLDNSSSVSQEITVTDQNFPSRHKGVPSLHRSLNKVFLTLSKHLKSSIILRDSKLYLDYVNFDDYDIEESCWDYYHDVDSNVQYNIHDSLDLEAGGTDSDSEDDDDLAYVTSITRRKSCSIQSPRSTLCMERTWRETTTSFTKKHVRFAESCTVVEIPHYNDLTIDELNDLYTSTEYIKILEQKNTFEARYEYELEQQKQPNPSTGHVQVFMDEDDYFCSLIDNKQVFLHPVHVPKQLLSSNYLLQGNGNDVCEIYKSERISVQSPVFLYPDEQALRLQLIATALLGELLFNSST